MSEVPGDGECQFTYDNDDVYIGNWKDGLKHGFGVAIYACGNQYAGTWMNDLKNGLGTFTFADGSCYVGSWKDDKKHGLGNAFFESKNEYDGEWEEDAMHGKGTFFYSNGDIYTGDWNKNTIQGFGVWTSAMRTDQYEGEWHKGVRHGKGVIRRRHMAYEVVYDNGTLQTKQLVPTGHPVTNHTPVASYPLEPASPTCPPDLTLTSAALQRESRGNASNRAARTATRVLREEFESARRAAAEKESREAEIAREVASAALAREAEEQARRAAAAAEREARLKAEAEAAARKRMEAEAAVAPTVDEGADGGHDDGGDGDGDGHDGEGESGDTGVGGKRKRKTKVVKKKKRAVPAQGGYDEVHSADDDSSAFPSPHRTSSPPKTPEGAPKLPMLGPGRASATAAHPDSDVMARANQLAARGNPAQVPARFQAPVAPAGAEVRGPPAASARKLPSVLPTIGQRAPVNTGALPQLGGRQRIEVDPMFLRGLAGAINAGAV